MTHQGQAIVSAARARYKPKDIAVAIPLSEE